MICIHVEHIDTARNARARSRAWLHDVCNTRDGRTTRTCNRAFAV